MLNKYTLTSLIGRKHTGYLHTTIYMVCAILAVVWIPQHTISEILFFLLISFPLAGYLISGFQHRYCSHKSWQPSRPVEILSVLLVTGFVLTPSMGWAGTHMNHHRYTDTELDPHGNYHSLWKNLFVFNYPPQLSNIPRWQLRDWLYAIQAKYYWEIIIPFAVLAFVLGFGQAYISFIGFCYVFQVSLNIVGHPNLEPTNNDFLAAVWGGELYHKFHHENPRTACFGKFDTTYHLFIKHLDTRGK